MMVRVWSGRVCPSCVTGETPLDAALTRFERAADVGVEVEVEVEVEQRSAERHPGAVARDVRSAESAEQLLDRLRRTAAYGPGLEDVRAGQVLPEVGSSEEFLDAVDRDDGVRPGLAMSPGADAPKRARLDGRLAGTSSCAR